MDYFGLQDLTALPKPKDFKEPDSEIGEKAPIDEEIPEAEVPPHKEIVDEVPIAAYDSTAEMSKSTETAPSAANIASPSSEEIMKSQVEIETLEDTEDEALDIIEDTIPLVHIPPYDSENVEKEKTSSEEETLSIIATSEEKIVDKASPIIAITSVLDLSLIHI